MRFLRPLLAAALLLGLAACDSKPKTAEPPAPRAEAAIGVNAEVENDVRLRSVQDQAWRPAALQGEVRFADDISTAADSRLVVALQDQSSLTVGPNARLTIDRFVIDTTSGAPGAAVSMTRGAFRFASQSRGKEAVSFRTPVATIGVRGTVLLGIVGPEALSVVPTGPAALVLSGDPQTATLVVLREGVIEVRFGETVMVLDQPGLAVAVGKDGRSYGPFMLPSASGRTLDALLAPRANRPTTAPPPLPPPPPPTVRAPPDRKVEQKVEQKVSPKVAQPVRDPPPRANPPRPDPPRLNPPGGGPRDREPTAPKVTAPTAPPPKATAPGLRTPAGQGLPPQKPTVVPTPPPVQPAAEQPPKKKKEEKKKPSFSLQIGPVRTPPARPSGSGEPIRQKPGQREGAPKAPQTDQKDPTRPSTPR
jgi:hypothetical protein